MSSFNNSSKNFFDKPLVGLLENDAKKTATSVIQSFTEIARNTGVAVSTSYTGISGSLYLGIKNICGSNLTHQDLDRPHTVKGGLMKGIIGLTKEIGKGVIGIYLVPHNKVKT